MARKESLISEYAARTVNGKLSGINSLLCFLGRNGMPQGRSGV